MEPSDSTIFQLFDPFCWLKDPVTKGSEEVGDSSIVLDVPIGGTFKYVFIVLDAVMESADLFIKVADFAGLLSVASSDGCKEPLCDGLEDVGIEVRVGCQSGRNGTGRHRWFQTLDWTNRERDTVLGRRGVGEIDRAV